MRHSYLRDEQGEPRLWWHSQNLSEGWYEHDRPAGARWQNGRAWLSYVPRWVRAGHQPGYTLGVEWHVGGAPRFSLSAQLHERYDEDDLSAHVVVPGFGLYLHSAGVLPKRFRPQRGGEIAVKWMDDRTLWLYPWVDPTEGRRADPWWRKVIIIDPATWLLGKRAYSERDRETISTTLFLPEGAYPVTVTLFTSVWKRPRWPFARTRRRATIDAPRETGIPVPGKGENSWDCDEDAVFSLTTPAGTEAEALGALRESVLRKRERYGGPNWTPREKTLA